MMLSAVGPLTQNACARVNLLGGFALFRADASPVQLTGARARGILACLLLAKDGRASREWLCELFWGDRGEAQARSSLRQSLFDIKAALQAADSDALHSDRDAIWLEKGRIASDVHDLAAVVEAGDAQRLTAALASISNLLLDDLGLGGSYQDWRNHETARLERALAIGVRSRLDESLARGDWSDAALLAEAWLRRDPLDEEVLAHAIRADRAAGANAAARRRYIAFRELLARELAIAPGPLVESAMNEVAAIASRTTHPAALANPLRPFSQPPLPHGFPEAKTPLFGRAQILDRLSGAWRAAVEGTASTVLLGGEPGIGKSSLAAEVARRAHADGAIVLFGAFDEDVRLSYRPFAEALRQYVAHASTAALQRHVAEHGGVLTRLVPELGAWVAEPGGERDQESEVDRHALFEATAGLFCGAAGEAPVLLVLDDLQWASGSDLQLLKHLVRSATSLRLQIVATFRESDIDAAHVLTPVLADLRREPTVERVSVTGLDEIAIRELIAAEKVGEQVEKLARTLHRETAGNPFFLRAVVQDWTELSSDHDVPDDGVRVPAGVREIVERRLGRLRPETARLLGIAAVVGQQFDMAIVAALAGSEASENDLLDALEQAGRAALVSEVANRRDCFRFSHAIVRTTLYEGQSAARRRRLHRRIGELLEVQSDGRADVLVEELAYHWWAGADASDAPKAVGYLSRAGDLAQVSLAFEASTVHYRRALALLDSFQLNLREARCTLLLARGAAERSAGDPQFRLTMAEAGEHARHLGEPALLARAAIGSGNIYGLQWGNGVDLELVARYEEALAGLGSQEPALRVRLMGQLAVELRNGPEEERRDALTREAIEIARSLGDDATLARVLASRIRVIESPFSLVERLELTRELEEIAVATGSLAVSTQAGALRFDALLQSGDLAGAEAALDRSRRAAEQLRAPFFAAFPQTLRTLLALMRGDPAAKILAYEGFAAMSAIGLAHAPNMLAGRLFELSARRGQLAAACDQIRDAAAKFPELTTFRAALVYALSEIGELDQARDLLSDFAAGKFAMRRDLNWATAVHLLSEASFTLGDARFAEVIYPDVAQVADQVGMSVGIKTEGALAHSAGLLAFLLGRRDDADAHMAFAIALNERIGAAPAAIASRRAYATMLIAHGDAGTAAPLVSEALARADALDLVAERDKLIALTDQLSVGPATLAVVVPARC